jgi:hypothetical protein
MGKKKKIRSSIHDIAPAAPSPPQSTKQLKETSKKGKKKKVKNGKKVKNKFSWRDIIARMLKSAKSKPKSIKPKSIKPKSLKQIMSEGPKIPSVAPNIVKRRLREVAGRHKFSGPTCVKHLKKGRVYLWVIRKKVMHAGLRLHKKKGGKHTDLTQMKKCQAAGELKVEKKQVLVNMRSGRYKNQDTQRGGTIVTRYLQQQPKPVVLRPFNRSLVDDPKIKYDDKQKLKIVSHHK